MIPTFKQIFMDKDTPINAQAILTAYKQHYTNISRLKNLYNYYIGQNTTIMGKQQLNPNIPNNRIAVPNGYYIVTVANGFTFANPLTYYSDTENIDKLLEENKKAKIASHDSEIGEDLSIFGVAYELVYMSKSPTQHVKINHLSPFNTFIVYTNEIDPEPLFAVYYYDKYNMSGEKIGIEFNVYDNEFLTIYESKNENDTPVLLEEPLPHFAEQVPIVQYKNNDEALGDYERVIPLIDSLDILTSDRINDKEQFINAILVVYGVLATDDENDPSDFKKALQTYRILEIPDTNARLEYLKQSLNEADIEVLKQSLIKDISKYSLVPELTDENFGTSSGIAMQYKTLGLQWLSNIKKRMFQKSLVRRLQIMSNYMNKLGRGFDWEDVEVKFNSSLPINTIEYLNVARDILSEKTLTAFLADKFGVSDVDQELYQKQQEQEQKAKAFDNNITFGE